MISFLFKTMPQVLFFTSVYAGGGGVVNSGGGHGVISGSKVFLLDFYNAGIHEAVSEKPCDPKQTRFQTHDLVLKGFDAELSTAISCKLEYFIQFDPVFASLIYQAILFHEWKFSDTPLIETDSSSPYQINQKIVQVAVRQSRYVYIQSSYWSSMNLHNRLGLVFHEVFSALSKPNVSIERIRQTLALLFSYSDYDEMRNLLTTDFPSTKQLYESYIVIGYMQPTSIFNFGRFSSADQLFEEVDAENFILKTSIYLYAFENNIIRLVPHITYRFSWRDIYGRIMQDEYSELFSTLNQSPLLKNPCGQNSNTFKLNGHDMSEAKLTQIRITWRQLQIQSSLEDQKGSLNPKVEFVLQDQVETESYEFPFEPNLTSVAHCSTNESDSIEIINKKLKKFEVLAHKAKF